MGSGPGLLVGRGYGVQALLKGWARGWSVVEAIGEVHVEVWCPRRAGAGRCWEWVHVGQVETAGSRSRRWTWEIVGWRGCGHSWSACTQFSTP